MKTAVKYPISLALCFIWIGFLGGISFLEAWLKFQAPGVTLSIGLNIGKLVFHALNKLEWFFTIGILAEHLLKNSNFKKPQKLLIYIPIVILLIQTFWLLPQLDIRAEQIIEGKTLPPSNKHFYFVGMEVIKTICLIAYGTSLLKPYRR